MSTFLAALVVLFALDVASTLYFLRLGIAEANPLISGLMKRWGPRTALFIVKVVALAVIAYVADDLLLWQRFVILAGYVGLIEWNLYRIYTVRRKA